MGSRSAVKAKVEARFSRMHWCSCNGNAIYSDAESVKHGVPDLVIANKVEKVNIRHTNDNRESLCKPLYDRHFGSRYACSECPAQSYIRRYDLEQHRLKHHSGESARLVMIKVYFWTPPTKYMGLDHPQYSSQKHLTQKSRP